MKFSYEVFRRQFLFSSKPTDQLKDWQFIAVGDRFLYVHPDCEVTRFDNGAEKLILIGYFLDPHQGNKSNLEILKEFAVCTTVACISEKLFPLVGRFVLIVQNNESFYIFNDACGLRHHLPLQKLMRGRTFCVNTKTPIFYT